jgi:hypothetical protein
MDELKLKNGFKFSTICQTLPTTQLGLQCVSNNHAVQNNIPDRGISRDKEIDLIDKIKESRARIVLAHKFRF